MFSSAWGDRKKKYPSQEDILERAKPALPLGEEFDDLFLKDLIWAHAVSLHQQLDTPQFHFAAPLVALLQRGLQDRSRLSDLLWKQSSWRGTLRQLEGGTSSWSMYVCPR